MADSVNPCPQPGPIKDLNADIAPPYCREQQADCSDQIVKESQKDVAGRDYSWLESPTLKKTGVGQNAQCDPMKTGYITNNQGGPDAKPNRNYIYRYGKGLRGCHEGVADLFRDLVIINEAGAEIPIPIIWATQEKAVAAILDMSNWVDADQSTVLKQVNLPILSIQDTSIQPDPKRYLYHKAVDYMRDFRRAGAPGFTMKESIHERDTVFGVTKGIPVTVKYTLYAWTMHKEDMLQIIEQIMPKVFPEGYIRVRGVAWEIVVKLESTTSNIDVEGGDKSVPVFKYQFNLSAETYLPQPIVRRQAVLKMKTEIVDSLDDEEITEVIARLEEQVKDLQ
jgi:hypothetical protein